MNPNDRELRIFRERDKLREQVQFWKGAALWALGLLFFVVCFCVGYGW